MANTKSARKATRKIARRTAGNKSRRSQMRTAVRDPRGAVILVKAGRRHHSESNPHALNVPDE